MTESNHTEVLVDARARRAYIGEIRIFAFEVPPVGWRECDGALLDTLDYPELFKQVQFTWGGDRQGKFNLPDLRGRFLRGWDHAAKHDPDATTRDVINTNGAQGDNVGSFQNHATSLPSGKKFEIRAAGDHAHSGSTNHTGAHSHEYCDPRGSSHIGHFNGSGWEGTNPQDTSVSGGHKHTVTTDVEGQHTHQLVGGDRETRGQNAYVLFAIFTGRKRRDDPR